MNSAAAPVIVLNSRPNRGGRPPILSPQDRRAMMVRFLKGETQPDLAKAFGVSVPLAYAVCASAAAVLEN